MITFNNSPLQASELLSLYPNQPISQPECFAPNSTYAVEEGKYEGEWHDEFNNALLHRKG